MPVRKLISVSGFFSMLVIAALSLSVQAELEVSTTGGGQRMVAKQLSATITAIDLDSREIVLEGPLGNNITLHAGEEVQRLNEFQVGDLVQASYMESLGGELREPTAEELLIPWAELDAAAIAKSALPPGVAAGTVIRAVCTIEGMNRATQTVTVLDPRGYFHVIGDVDPERMKGVTLGQTIILTYTRAVALSLEKHPAS
jgi:hypothetical protein